MNNRRREQRIKLFIGSRRASTSGRLIDVCRRLWTMIYCLKDDDDDDALCVAISSFATRKKDAVASSNFAARRNYRQLSVGDDACLIRPTRNDDCWVVYISADDRRIRDVEQSASGSRATHGGRRTSFEVWSWFDLFEARCSIGYDEHCQLLPAVTQLLWLFVRSFVVGCRLPSTAGLNSSLSLIYKRHYWAGQYSRPTYWRLNTTVQDKMNVLIIYIYHWTRGNMTKGTK